MIDTHCHLTFEDFRAPGRVDQVVAAAAAAGVDRMITIGTTPEDGSRAAEIAEQFPNVYMAAGLHPHYCADWQDSARFETQLLPLLSHPKIVAIGEMGLDRHYPDPPIELQRRAFEWQLALMADRVQLPGIIHNREATDETIAMIRAAGLPGDRFVFHCFTGDDAELDAILDLGAMVSFTGIVTFKNARHLAASASRVPIDRLMIETDSPFLTPEPHRKVRPNEPRFVADVARFLAQARNMDHREFIANVDANAMRFFGLK